MRSYQGNRYPFCYALFAKADRREAMAVLGALDRQGVRVALPVRRNKKLIRRAALVLLFLSPEAVQDRAVAAGVAQATAAAVYLARTGSSIPEIRAYISGNFYPLDRTLEEIRPDYRFNETCQGTVPEAITAFLESDSFEDAIRNAISLGGDSDTVGAITGAVAWAYYGRDGIQPDMRSMLDEIRLPEDLQTVVDDFAEYCAGHAGTGR